MANNFQDSTFDNEVLQSEKAVLVDFWADWCGPCKMLGPLIDEIANEVGDKIKIGKLDIDTNQQTASKYQVMSIPTVIIFKGGQPVKTLVGVQPKQIYLDAINELA
jgi:thioredoxin 1